MVVGLLQVQGQCDWLLHHMAEKINYGNICFQFNGLIYRCLFVNSSLSCSVVAVVIEVGGNLTVICADFAGRVGSN